MQTLLLWKGDQGLLSRANQENVFLSGGEGLSVGVLDVGNIVTSDVSFDVGDLTNSTDVVATGDETEVSEVSLDPFGDFAIGNIVLDAVSLFDIWVWESDGSSVVSNDVWDLVWSDTSALDTE